MPPNPPTACRRRARTRCPIDAQLHAAGWVVQEVAQLNLFAAVGVAVREVVMAPGHSRVDYLLYVDKQVVGDSHPPRRLRRLCSTGQVPRGAGRVRAVPPIGYDELVARDRVNFDITWLRDESTEDLDSLPPPEVLALEIVQDLTAALAEFEAVAEALEVSARPRTSRT